MHTDSHALHPNLGHPRLHYPSAWAFKGEWHRESSEPTLPREVALYADSRGAYWTRVINDLSGPIRLIFAPGRSPTATLMAHALCILLIWHRHLMVPTLAI